jgi:DNA-binding CsgD family transcriptional regulator
MAGMVHAPAAPGNPTDLGVVAAQPVSENGPVLPRARDYQRVKRQIEMTLDQPGHDTDEPIETVVAAGADLLGIIGSCWHHTDPASGLPIASGTLGEPAGSLEWSIDYEYHRPDVNRFAELASRRSPLAAISLETGGEMRASARFHEMIEPTGAADELRVAFVDAFGFWAALVIFTNRRMTADDLRFVSELFPVVTAALRSTAAASALSSPASDDDDGPSVLILGQDDRIVTADAAARRRLAMLPEPRAVDLPGLISFVSAQARWSPGGRASQATMRTLDGQWLLVDASRLEADGDVAVVMQPAPSGVVLDGALRAMGLSSREREVAALVLRGQPAKAIASALMISPWTVQDHLKAIYDKTGVRSRAELIGLVPACA